MDPSVFCEELVNRVEVFTEYRGLVEAVRRLDVLCNDSTVRTKLRLYFHDDALNEFLDDAGDSPLLKALGTLGEDTLPSWVLLLLEPLLLGSVAPLPEYHTLSAPACPAATYDADKMLTVATAAAHVHLGGALNLAPFGSVDELVSSPAFRTMFRRPGVPIVWKYFAAQPGLVGRHVMTALFAAVSKADVAPRMAAVEAFVVALGILAPPRSGVSATAAAHADLKAHMVAAGMLTDPQGVAASATTFTHLKVEHHDVCRVFLEEPVDTSEFPADGKAAVARALSSIASGAAHGGSLVTVAPTFPADKPCCVDATVIDLALGESTPLLRYPPIRGPFKPADGSEALTAEAYVDVEFVQHLNKLHEGPDVSILQQGGNATTSQYTTAAAAGAGGAGTGAGAGAGAGAHADEAPSQVFLNRLRDSAERAPKGGMSWALKSSFYGGVGAMMPDFVRYFWFRTPLQLHAAAVLEHVFWPTVVGETKPLDTSIVGAVPQYHRYACAILRPLQLVYGLEVVATMGRVVAGGTVQYFLTYFKDRKYCTRPVSPPYVVVGEGVPASTYHAIACFEEATVWLAKRNERDLNKFAFLAMRAGADPSEPPGEGPPDAQGPLWASSTPTADQPHWWPTGSAVPLIGVMVKELVAQGYDPRQILKISTQSVVLRCARVISGDQVVVKLYPGRPVEPERCLRALHGLASAGALPPGTAAAAVFDVLPSSLGYLLVMQLMPPPPPLLPAVANIVLPAVKALVDTMAQHHMYHGDLHVGNVSYDPVTHTVALIDFDTTRVLQADDPDLATWKQRDVEGWGYLQEAFTAAGC